MAIAVALISNRLQDQRLSLPWPNFFSILRGRECHSDWHDGLLKLPPEYLLPSKAAIPGLFGLATLFSVNTRWPLVSYLFIQ